MTRIGFVVLAAVALGACAPEFEPPPDYRGGFLWDSTQSRTITVAPGDTLYTISRRYDVPTRLIIARNGLQPPYALRPGETLILDPARLHRVQAGETLGSIAAQYGVTTAMIAEVNELQQMSVRSGQDLWIPDPFTVAAAAPVPPSVSAASSVTGTAPAGTASAPRSSSILKSNLPPPPGTAALPPVSPAPAVAAPAAPTAPSAPVIDPNAPMSMPVTAPPAAPVQQPPPSAPGEPVMADATPSLPQAPVPPLPPSPPSAAIPPAPVVAPATPAAPGIATAPAQPTPPAVPAVPGAASARFIWPVKGRLISGFGPAGRGLHNDGINIAAPVGTQVRAADAGVVAYAGSELKGFGNLLLIKHADGLTTAYAHNDKLLVARGDEVRQGQVIATVGKTGNVDAPQLHFEVRRGTQAVDPQLYLQR